MERAGLYKNQTLVVQVLFTAFALFVSLAARAQAQGPITINNPGPASCGDYISQVSGNFGAAVAACGGTLDCLNESLNCEANEGSLGSDVLASEGAAGENCENLVNTLCPEYNAGTSSTYRDEKRDARRDRRDAMREKDRAAEYFQKSQADLLKQQNEAAEKMVKLRQEYRDKREKLQADIEKEMSEAEKAKLEGYKQAQEAYDKIDSEYIKLRDNLRGLSYKINNGELAWKVGCRAEAQAESKKMKAALDQRMAEEAKLVNQINNQASGLFGLKYRKLAKKRKKIADTYNETLVRCLKGEAGMGVKAKVELDQMRWEYKRAEAHAKDLEAQMERQRMNIAQQLEKLVQSTDQKLQRAGARLNQQLANADQDFNDNMQLLQQQQAAAQQQAMQAQQMNMKKLEGSNREFMEASRDEALASNREVCAALNGGKLTKAEADERPKSTASRKKAKEAFFKSVGSCAAAQAACSETQYESVGKICRSVNNMQQAEVDKLLPQTPTRAAPAAVSRPANQ